MDEVISISEANRRFSFILRQVCNGQRYTVTSHGRPVARIIPAPATRTDEAADRAWAALLARLEKQEALNLGPWSREELYEDGE